MSFLWPRHVETFRAAGLCERIQKRLVSLGGEEMAGACEAAFDELTREERSEVFLAIRGGEGYQTIWQRTN